MPDIDFARVFEDTPDPYMLLDRDLRYAAANAAYLRVTGRTKEELLGGYVFDAFPNDPEDPTNENTRIVRESFERVLKSGVTDVLPLIPYRIPEKREGRTVHVERFWSLTHTPILGRDGTVAYMLQHAVDVTDLHALRQRARVSPTDQVEAGVLGRAHQAEQRSRSLDAERRHLINLFEQAPGFMCFLRGEKHVFELANAAYHQLIGHRDLVGKAVREALPELAGQGYVELLDTVYSSGKPFVGTSMPANLQRVPGAKLDTVYLDLVYQPILDDSGSVTGIFVQGHDITAQKRLEDERSGILAREQAARAEAERANRLKDEFLATVSHELRTPLTAMMGWANMSKHGHLPPEQHARALDTIERNARAQAQLVGDLLDVSRIMSGKMELEVEVLDVTSVVEAALESIRPAADAKSIRLVPRFDAEARVMGDPGRLQQVAWNLLSNAVKFTPKQGNIEVRVTATQGSIELCVMDDGQGIEPDFLPYVFDRFRQAEGSATRKYGGLGLGLGLAIVKHLVELHGGSVSVSSEGAGRGSTFTVSLPLAAQRSETSPLPVTTSHGAELLGASAIQGLKLLVVEDDEDGRELMKMVLEACGAEVETAPSAREGLALLKSFRPDVLLSDIGMPDVDGYLFLKQLRALPASEGGRTPAIALTAFARAEDRTKALLAGFHAHVPKPVDSAELVAVLASITAPK